MGRTLSVILVDNGEAGADEAASGLAALDIIVQRVRSDRFDPKAHKTNAILSFCALDQCEIDLPYLSVGARDPQASAFLDAPAHPIQLAARLRSLVRLSVLETTARLRVRDAEATGVALPPAQVGPATSSVLFVGAPCPAFMRLQHALAGAQIEVLAAFSTFNAFDYLHERAFDAVVLNTDPDPDLAHTVCSAMRRNTRLFHTPAILLTRGEVFSEADEAFARGASDVLSDAASETQMRERINVLGMERRRRRRAKAMLERCRVTALLDATSDLYARPFGERHVLSLAQEAERRGESMALIGLHAHAPGHINGERRTYAQDQFAAMLRHCVRAEDLAVRLSENAYILALPNTPLQEAQLVADRVSAIAECTAYDGGTLGQSFRLGVKTSVQNHGAACRIDLDDLILQARNTGGLAAYA